MNENKIDKNEILRANNSLIIGELETDLEYLPGIGWEKETITVMRNSNNVVFYVRPISAEPLYIRKNINTYTGTTYIGIDIHNINFFPSSYRNKAEDEKVEIAKQLFENKLILFRPHIEVKGDKIFKNLSIVEVIDKTEADSVYKYDYIPKVNMRNEEFERKVKDREPIKFEGIYPDLMNINFQYIFCGNYLYGYIDGCNNTSKMIDSCYVLESEVLKRIQVDYNDSAFKSNSAVFMDSAIFLNRKYLEKLDNNLADNGVEVVEENSEKNNANDENDDLEKDNLISINMNTEIKFLNEFRTRTLCKRLFYSKIDLDNFHISLKSNMLTILAGMSGTGKTQIARCYAEALGLSSKDKTLLFLPISPSYTEPEDLLGYLNTNTGLYMPSSTGLVDFLIEAENNSDKMYMVIFDEMNLSQIEHWFSPFISLLELDADDRNLVLYSEESICHNKAKYKNQIKIRDNILFVGTVNLDETTKEMSDRVLDRASVITLKKRSFADLKKSDIVIIDGEKNDIENNIGFEQYKGWTKKNKSFIETFTQNELEFFDKLHELLITNNGMSGISFRVMKSISDYIINIPEDSEELLIKKRDAFDLCVKQRILTKIKGSDRQLDELINGETEDNQSIGKLFELFDSEEAKEISDFSEVKSVLKRKSKELGKYGYTN